MPRAAMSRAARGGTGRRVPVFARRGEERKMASVMLSSKCLLLLAPLARCSEQREI